MNDSRYIIKVVIVNLVVGVAGGAAGFFAAKYFDAKALGWMAIISGVIGGLTNSCSTLVFRRIDDIGTISWPDPQVREKLRKQAAIRRSVFRARWLSIWVAWPSALIAGFLIAFYNGHSAPDWLVAIASAAFILALYLSLRFVQAFIRLTAEWSKLLKEKDDYEQRQTFLQGIHA